MGASIANSIGRKNTIRVILIPYTIGVVMGMLAPEYYTLLISRVIGGIGVGASSVVVTPYCMELSAPHSRAMFGLYNQLFICIGVAGALSISYFMQTWENGWRWMIGSALVPLVIQAIGVFSDLVESPRWLLFKGREAESLETLKKLRFPDEDVLSEFNTFKAEAAAAGTAASMKDVLKLKKQVAIAVMVMFVQQMTGVNAVCCHGYAPPARPLCSRSCSIAVRYSRARASMMRSWPPW